MSDRPHCLNRDTCAAAKPTSHCRRCALARINADPEMQLRRMAALRAKYDDPAYRAEHLARLAQSMKKIAGTPWRKKQLVESGQRLQREHARRPEVLAKAHSPEANAKRSAACTATRLPWCPPDLVQEYRELVRRKGLRAHEARAVIEQIIQERDPVVQARKAIARFDAAQRARAERERQQAL